ncbi:Bug family tripartite tricarboxylate transporter substrate binding protein [Aquabacterium humicola]|uniref:Bug family tripartite tricarboxylate transporter substrate binding protein n=1 Tax=Aquabacterium humicola TaxID=3237377 RepID=UPI00254379A5|nr:tripartite tricarboxylate transporter substrate binding protein [Rubrivivax pictus]
MALHRRQFTFATAGALAAPLLAPLAVAQGTAWPSRPLRLVTGGPAGIADIRGRWLAERLAAALGQPVVVENNGAAGGNVGAEQVARAAPDGYTLLVVHQGIAAINPHLYAQIGFDPLRDFAPVTRFGHGSLLLTVHPGVTASSVRELIALARQKPGTLNFGSPGNGTPPHLAAEMFRRAAGIESTHIPFKGGGAMMASLLAGHVQWCMEGLTAQLPHVRAGSLRALAVTGARRVPSLPDLPTIAEAGVPGYEYAGWTGIAAPAGTPRAVVERLQAEIARIAATDEARQWFAATGADAGVLSPDAFGAFIRDEHARFGKLIRDAGLRAE